MADMRPSTKALLDWLNADSATVDGVGNVPTEKYNELLALFFTVLSDGAAKQEALATLLGFYYEQAAERRGWRRRPPGVSGVPTLVDDIAGLQTQLRDVRAELAQVREALRNAGGSD